MIKQIFLVITCFLAANELSAQQHAEGFEIVSSAEIKRSPRTNTIYAIMAGIDFPSVSSQYDNITISARPGVLLGMRWGVDLGRWEIVPEILYSYHSADATRKNSSGNEVSGQVRNNSIEMPILFAYEINDALRVNLGPQLSLLSSSKVEMDNGESFEFGQYKSTVGYAASLSYTFYQGYFIDLRYTGRFASSENVWIDGTKDEHRHSNFGVNIGYRF